MLADGQRVLDLALDAGRQALASAQIDPGSVDFLIYASVGRAWLEPATAHALQTGLDVRRATCFDVLDACAGWLRALQVARAYIRSGAYRRGLIVNCEAGILREHVGYRFESPEELEHRVAGFTIGEAATATVVTDDNPRDDFYVTFRSAGEHIGLCLVPLPSIGSFVTTNLDPRLRPGQFYTLSRPLFDLAGMLIVELFQSDQRLLAGRYDVAFGHEASRKVSERITKALGVADVYFPTHARFGNTVSASIPLAMSVAQQEGRLRRGDTVLTIVGSAGMTVGLASFTF
jgi:3-oxoacyl-[acyl-carrier-protein] synthase III